MKKILTTIVMAMLLMITSANAVNELCSIHIKLFEKANLELMDKVEKNNMSVEELIPYFDNVRSGVSGVSGICKHYLDDMPKLKNDVANTDEMLKEAAALGLLGEKYLLQSQAENSAVRSINDVFEIVSYANSRVQNKEASKPLIYSPISDVCLVEEVKEQFTGDYRITCKDTRNSSNTIYLFSDSKEVALNINLGERFNFNGKVTSLYIRNGFFGKSRRLFIRLFD